MCVPKRRKRGGSGAGHGEDNFPIVGLNGISIKAHRNEGIVVAYLLS